MSKLGGSNRQAIFTEQELEKSMDRIEASYLVLLLHTTPILSGYRLSREKRSQRNSILAIRRWSRSRCCHVYD